MKYALIDITAAGGHLRLWYEAGIYTASISNGTGTASLTVAATEVPAEDGVFALRYDDDEFSLLFNGEVLSSLSVVPPEITSISGIMYVGCDFEGNQWDDVIGPVRVSSVARTDAALASDLRVDKDTLAFFPFLGSLTAGYTYIATPFQVTLPDDRDDQISRATLTVDNVDRRMVEAIRSINGSPTVTMSIVLGSTPQQIEAGPFEFRLSSVGYDALTVEGSLGYEEDFLNTGFPADDFTPQTTPGIFS